MPELAIHGVARVHSISEHATQRYRERRQQLPCFILDDLKRARPLTKGQMRKLQLRRRHFFQYLKIGTFLFVIVHKRLVTCYYINTKVSTYELDSNIKNAAKPNERRPTPCFSRSQLRTAREL